LIRATSRPGDGLYQVGVEIINDGRVDFTQAYTLEEAEELIGELDRVTTEIREAQNRYVQVQFMTDSRPRKSGLPLSYAGLSYALREPYTYRDPSGDLEVGDLVEVPTRYGPNLAKVVALGRGDFAGPVLDVTARLSRETLAA
jgi:hypothetical protein